jgi:uncharacterized protein HemX
MSAELKTAVVNEALDLSHMFKQNCALKHGLPEIHSNRISKLTDDPPAKQEPPIVNITNNIPAAPAATNTPSPGAGAADAVKQTLLGKAAPFLLSAAIGSAAVPAYWWLTQDEKAPVVQDATEPQPRDGDLLQFLQSQGMHLPEGQPWTNP